MRYTSLMLALCVFLAATTTDVLPLDELARRSDVIAEVRVASHDDVALPNGARARITTLIVERAMKGAHTSDRLTLFQPLVGGALVDGAYAFRDGDVRVVFFARKTGAPELVLQMAPGLGVFTIDARNGSLSEDVGDVVDLMSGVRPRARAFADRAAFMRALSVTP